MHQAAWRARPRLSGRLVVAAALALSHRKSPERPMCPQVSGGAIPIALGDDRHKRWSRYRSAAQAAAPPHPCGLDTANQRPAAGATAHATFCTEFGSDAAGSFPSAASTARHRSAVDAGSFAAGQAVGRLCGYASHR